MYNDSVIQEQSGLNAFYNKIYSLVGIGVGISALVSGLMMTVFQDFCSSDLLDLLSFEWLYLELYHCSLHASNCL